MPIICFIYSNFYYMWEHPTLHIVWWRKRYPTLMNFTLDNIKIYWAAD